MLSVGITPWRKLKAPTLSLVGADETETANLNELDKHLTHEDPLFRD
jgi:hypothetical protein